MANPEIEIKLTAIDEASDVIAAASKKISANVDEVSNSQKELSASVEGSLSPLSDDAQAQEKVGKSAKQSEVSLRSFTTGISGPDPHPGPPRGPPACRPPWPRPRGPATASNWGPG